MEQKSLILEITEYQEANGVLELQEVINNGNAWHMEGSVGRAAMDCLKNGECYLPDKAFRGAFGNKIPSRNELEKGTFGTLEYCYEYWNSVVEFD